MAPDAAVPAIAASVIDTRAHSRAIDRMRAALAQRVWRAVCAVALLVLMPQLRAQHLPGCDFADSLQRFEALRLSEGLPGAALLLGARDGLLLEHYAGNYNAETVVAVASASKLLSAVRLLQLADQGVVDLHAPIGGQLPEFSGDKAAMTLAQLFSHTSGYGNDSAAPEITDRSLSLAEAVAQIACCRDFPAGFGVGQQFAYGGVSMHIGGRAMEVASGQDWQLGWQQELGQPLGIRSIDWQAFGPTANYMIAGGARSSLRDYGQVLHLLLNEGRNANGERILSVGAVRSLWQDQIVDRPVIDPPPAVDGDPRYGIGSWIEGGPGDETPPRIHSLGAFGFMPWVDSEAGLFGVFMVRGLPGINNRALPVYRDLMGALTRAAHAPECRPFETFPTLFAGDFESPRPLLASPAN